MKTSNSQALFNEAQQFIPGGVNSPVRAFKAVGGNPIFMKSAKGPYLYDEDGNRYIDMINSWGPMILGHGHPAVEEAILEAVKNSTSFGTPGAREVEIAELITNMVPSIDKVRMVNSGTEATMSAIRLARGFTGRDKVIKFEGCYHGHGDSFLIAAGSGAITMGTPDSPGVTKGTAQDTLLAEFGNLASVEELVDSNKNSVAAIIIEPVAGNMGCVVPDIEFLTGLRKLCDQQGIVLIFDEVMTGFRLAPGGAQQVFNVMPDLTTLGKIIGGGMPVGAYGGKKEIMDFVSPQGPVYQAGTLSGNPVAMAAGIAMLKELQKPGIYESIEAKANKLVSGIEGDLKEFTGDFCVNHIGSMYTLFFGQKQVTNFAEAKGCNTEKFGKYFRLMLEKGIYLAPSQFESLFVSNALSDEDIDQLLNANRESVKEVFS